MFFTECMSHSLNKPPPCTHRVIVPDGFPGPMVGLLLNTCHKPFPIDGHNLVATTNGDFLAYFSLLMLEKQTEEYLGFQVIIPPSL